MNVDLLTWLERLGGIAAALHTGTGTVWHPSELPTTATVLLRSL